MPEHAALRAQRWGGSPRAARDAPHRGRRHDRDVDALRRLVEVPVLVPSASDPPMSQWWSPPPLHGWFKCSSPSSCSSTLQRPPRACSWPPPAVHMQVGIHGHSLPQAIHARAQKPPTTVRDLAHLRGRRMGDVGVDEDRATHFFEIRKPRHARVRVAQGRCMHRIRMCCFRHTTLGSLSTLQARGRADTLAASREQRRSASDRKLWREDPAYTRRRSTSVPRSLNLGMVESGQFRAKAVRIRANHGRFRANFG